MQARNPTVKALTHSDPTRDRGWILAHEDDFFAAENEESGTDAQEHEFPARREKRETVFRVAEYSRYPRVDRDQRRLNAFVRNESTSGMCLVSDQAEPVGSCLRVGLQGVDGFPTEDAVGRVVWTCQQADGRHWLGLSLLNPRTTHSTQAFRIESRGKTNEFIQTARSGLGLTPKRSHRKAS